jgi:hypothetical protein
MKKGALKMGWNSSVDIVTGYGMDGPRIEPGGGEIFRTRQPPVADVTGTVFHTAGNRCDRYSVPNRR